LPLPISTSVPSELAPCPPAVVTPIAAAQQKPPEKSCAEQKSDYFHAIKLIFKNQKLQKKWLDVEHIVEAINNLAAMPKTSVARGDYQSKDFLPALQSALGKAMIVGDDPIADFNSATRKEFFFAKHKTVGLQHSKNYIGCILLI
jgi:hypothetical protein